MWSNPHIAIILRSSLIQSGTTRVSLIGQINLFKRMFKMIVNFNTLALKTLILQLSMTCLLV